MTAIVIAGIALAVAIGASRGLDLPALMILIVLVAVGALAIAVTRRSSSGAVGPARCVECGGLISPNAPSCKHCGASVGGS